MLNGQPIGNPKSNCKGSLNSRPTPKAFGAAPPLQVMNGNLWVLLLLQKPLDPSSLGNGRDFFFRNDLEVRVVSLSPCGRANVEQTARQGRLPSRCSGDRLNRGERKSKPFGGMPGGRIELPTKGL